jgi:hypothetical protein
MGVDCDIMGGLKIDEKIVVKMREAEGAQNRQSSFEL